MMKSTTEKHRSESEHELLRQAFQVIPYCFVFGIGHATANKAPESWEELKAIIGPAGH
jgi:hypothetical protein